MKNKNASTVKSKMAKTSDALLKEAFALPDTAKKLNDAVRISNEPRAPFVHMPSLEQPLASSSFKFSK